LPKWRACCASAARCWPVGSCACVRTPGARSLCPPPIQGRGPAWRSWSRRSDGMADHDYPFTTASLQNGVAAHGLFLGGGKKALGPKTECSWRATRFQALDDLPGADLSTMRPSLRSRWPNFSLSQPSSAACPAVPAILFLIRRTGQGGCMLPLRHHAAAAGAPWHLGFSTAVPCRIHCLRPSEGHYLAGGSAALLGPREAQRRRCPRLFRRPGNPTR